MAEAALLEVSNLSVSYGGIQALRSVSLEVRQGEIVAIIGANGAGKSTLMRTIAGDKERAGGAIRIHGAPLPTAPHQVVARGISLVPEGRRIFPSLTVRENLMVGAYLRKDRHEVAADFAEVVAIFPRLAERLTQKGGTLSGGEQQMLALGRALMARPKVLLLDEPSLGLAPIVVEELFDKIQAINRERGLTIVLVEQNAFLALEVAHRAYVLVMGEVQREGTGAELLADPAIRESYLGATRRP